MCCVQGAGAGGERAAAAGGALHGGGEGAVQARDGPATGTGAEPLFHKLIIFPCITSQSHSMSESRGLGFTISYESGPQLDSTLA